MTLYERVYENDNYHDVKNGKMDNRDYYCVLVVSLIE